MFTTCLTVLKERQSEINPHIDEKKHWKIFNYTHEHTEINKTEKKKKNKTDKKYKNKHKKYKCNFKTTTKRIETKKNINKQKKKKTTYIKTCFTLAPPLLVFDWFKDFCIIFIFILPDTYIC